MEGLVNRTRNQRPRRNHSLSDVLESSENHDPYEGSRYRPGQASRPEKLVEEDGISKRSTVRTKQTELSKDDTIATRQGMKSMREIVDTFGVEGSARPISKTFVRPSPPQELLDYPIIINHRVSMNMFTMAPL